MTQIASNNRSSTRSNSSRGGQRRRSGGNNRPSGGRPRGTSKQPQKKGFFAKLLSIFGVSGDSNKGTGRPKSVKRVSGDTRTSERRDPKPKRTPEIVPVESPRLYLGNLSYDATESDLMELFGGVGTVQEVEIITHRRTQRSKGYAFLEMTTVEEAARAVQKLHDKDFMGRKLVVSGAKDRGASEDRD